MDGRPRALCERVLGIPDYHTDRRGWIQLGSPGFEERRLDQLGLLHLPVHRHKGLVARMVTAATGRYRIGRAIGNSCE